MARRLYGQLDLVTNKGITFADPGAAQDAATQNYVVTGLALKAPLASPALTGTPTSTTAATDTNTTQIATTAFVVGQAGSVVGTTLGIAAVGTSLKYARQDHVHPNEVVISNTQPTDPAVEFWLDTASSIASGAKITVSNTAPSSPAVNDLWVDTT